jgi:thiamine-monophosphate kinase
MDEKAFIAQTKSKLGKPPRFVKLGIGDDCAALTVGSSPVLFASDMLMDQVHFDLAALRTGYLVGRKALAVNLSDIAAMGGEPLAVCVSLGLPQKNGARIGREVMAGMKSLADEYDVAIVGGDTNSWSKPLVVNVAIIGKAHPRGIVTRAGAHPGDLLFVSGTLGGSFHGKHLTFEPRLDLGRWLTTHYLPTAMVDLSDGLANDVGHIISGSGCGAEIDLTKIPISTAALKHTNKKPPLERALSDGEDFELAFCLSPSNAKKLLARKDFHQLGLTCIGKMIRERKLLGIDLKGKRAPIKTLGYEHKFI